MKLKELQLGDTNLYLRGFDRDQNGNSIIQLAFDGERGFSIQINNPGFFKFTYPCRGYALKELSEEQIAGISSEVISHIKKYDNSRSGKLIEY